MIRDKIDLYVDNGYTTDSLEFLFYYHAEGEE